MSQQSGERIVEHLSHAFPHLDTVAVHRVSHQDEEFERRDHFFGWFICRRHHLRRAHRGISVDIGGVLATQIAGDQEKSCGKRSLHVTLRSTLRTTR